MKKNQNATRRAFDGIEFRKDGIYSLSLEAQQIRVADPILVTAFADQMDGHQAFTKISHHQGAMDL
jgi:hypothetical protein